MGLYEQLLKEHSLFKSTLSQQVKKYQGALTYASGRDAARRYSENQERWKAFSEEVISELVRNMSQDTGEFSISEAAQWQGPQGNSDFDNLFRFCARKRSEIARELNHDEAERFGDFRGEHFASWENLYGDPNKKQAWRNVQKEVFSHMISLVSEIPSEEYKKGYIGHGRKFNAYPPGEKTYENDLMFVRCEKITATQKEKSEAQKKGIDLDNFTCYDIHFKTPKFESSVTGGQSFNRELCHISMLYNSENSRQNKMKIIYADVNKYNQKGNFNIANHYYHNLVSMSTETKEDRMEFLKELGRLNHFMAQILPVKRGNSSICEWITRAVAYKKGIELGEFNTDEPLPWDFKAIVTPDKEIYAEWYAKNAFLDMIIDSGPQSIGSISL